MNGWMYLIVFTILWVATVDPVRSQINCGLGVQAACRHLEEVYQ